MDWLFQIEAIKAEIPLARLHLVVISHPGDRDQEAVFDQKGLVMSCPAALLPGLCVGIHPSTGSHPEARHHKQPRLSYFPFPNFEIWGLRFSCRGRFFSFSFRFPPCPLPSAGDVSQRFESVFSSLLLHQPDGNGQRCLST